MRLVYSIGIWFYALGVRVAAMFGHVKARQMVRGWRDCLNVLMPECLCANADNTQTIKQSNNQAIKWVWFHAASLGEFEQARPVLEEYRRRHPECRVLLTFFSPSGYEVRKNYPQADVVCYLPPDTPRNAARFVDAFHPTVVFFVKYEFWFNYLNQLRKAGIPTYIFSAIFRENQYFFKWYGKWFLREVGRCFTHLFVQNRESVELLRNHGIENCDVAGDTRFDRVHEIAEQGATDAVVERWLEVESGKWKVDSKVLVAGSTWPQDEALLHQLKVESGKWKVILAPHVISEEHIRQIEGIFPDSIRYSQIENGKWKMENSADAPYNSQFSILNSQFPKVLIIDNMGLLSKLYRYADVAYIGGGFGVGIHNILEAITFGKPVLFGPNYRKFQEACDIIALGGGWSVTDDASLSAALTPLMTDDEAYNRASKACLDYMERNLGSTKRILNAIED